MHSVIKVTLVTAFMIGGLQSLSFAQKNSPAPTPDTSADSPPSFQDLLDQIRDDNDPANAPDERPQLPRPAALDNLPTVPGPKTPPVFPTDDGAPRELPWAGLEASPALAKTEDGIENTVSKLQCADNVAGYKLQAIRQITAVGDAFSCQYKHDLGQPEISSLGDPIVHILMFKPPRGRTAEDQMADFRSDTEADMASSRLSSSTPQTVRFGNQQIVCPSTTYALGSGTSAQSLTNTICDAGDWRIRIKLISKDSVDIASPEEFVSEFANAQAPAMRHADKCEAFVTRVANGQPSGVNGISYNAVAFPYAERGESCYAGHTSSAEGSMLVRYWPDNPDTPLTFDFVSPNGQYQETPSFRIQNMWANVPANEAGPDAYLLMREQADGTITIYGGYTRIPTDGRVYRDAVDAYDGETDAIFLAKQNEGGGWTMMGQ